MNDISDEEVYRRWRETELLKKQQENPDLPLTKNKVLLKNLSHSVLKPKTPTPPPPTRAATQPSVKSVPPTLRATPTTPIPELLSTSPTSTPTPTKPKPVKAEKKKRNMEPQTNNTTNNKNHQQQQQQPKTTPKTKGQKKKKALPVLETVKLATLRKVQDNVKLRSDFFLIWSINLKKLVCALEAIHDSTVNLANRRHVLFLPTGMSISAADPRSGRHHHLQIHRDFFAGVYLCPAHGFRVCVDYCSFVKLFQNAAAGSRSVVISLTQQNELYIGTTAPMNDLKTAAEAAHLKFANIFETLSNSAIEETTKTNVSAQLPCLNVNSTFFLKTSSSPASSSSASSSSALHISNNGDDNKKIEKKLDKNNDAPTNMLAENIEQGKIRSFNEPLAFARYPFVLQFATSIFKKTFLSNNIKSRSTASIDEEIVKLKFDGPKREFSLHCIKSSNTFKINITDKHILRNPFSSTEQRIIYHDTTPNPTSSPSSSSSSSSGNNDIISSSSSSNNSSSPNRRSSSSSSSSSDSSSSGSDSDQDQKSQSRKKRKIDVSRSTADEKHKRAAVTTAAAMTTIQTQPKKEEKKQHQEKREVGDVSSACLEVYEDYFALLPITIALKKLKISQYVDFLFAPTQPLAIRFYLEYPHSFYLNYIAAQHVVLNPQQSHISIDQIVNTMVSIKKNNSLVSSSSSASSSTSSFVSSASASTSLATSLVAAESSTTSRQSVMNTPEEIAKLRIVAVSTLEKTT